MKSGLQLAAKPVHRPYSTPPRPSLRSVPRPTKDSVELPSIQAAAVLLAYCGMGAGAVLLRGSEPVFVGAALGALAAAAAMIVHLITASLTSRGALGWIGLVAFTGVMVMFALRENAPFEMRVVTGALAARPAALAAGYLARAVGDQVRFLFKLPIFAVVAVVVMVGTAVQMH